MKTQVIDGTLIIDGADDQKLSETQARLTMAAEREFTELLFPLFHEYGIVTSCNAIATLFLKMLANLPEEARDMARRSAKTLPDALEIAFKEFDRDGRPDN